MEDCNRAIELDPNYALVYYNRGVSYAEQGEYDRAIEDYDRAIELDPNDPGAYSSRAASYTEQGEYVRAIEDCNRAIEVNSNDCGVYSTRGAAYAAQGEYDRAIEDYDRAIEVHLNHATKLRPNYAVYYSNRGVAYHRKGEYDRAIEDCNRAIEINPEHALLYLARGSILKQLRAVDALLIDIDNAVRLCSNYETDFLDRKLLSDDDVIGEAIKTLSDVANDPETPECVAAYYWGVRKLYINPFAATEVFIKARELGFSDHEKLDRHLQNLRDRGANV